MTKLRNFGMITESEFIGKTVEEATSKAQNDGFVVRIVERDGDSFILTMDHKTDRINFRVRNNTIIGAYGG